ncbi:MAG: hypothetical protein AB7J32_14755 [Pseudonocardia sp.]
MTLVGPGGVGKTQVALEVARRSDTATVLMLAPVTDPAAVPHAQAAALNLTVTRGDVLAACLALLGERPALLVLDNCEHLPAAVRVTVEAVPAACPALTVLATSREPLGLAAEHRSRLAPCPFRAGVTISRRCRPSRSSSTAPAASGPRRATCTWWPTSSAGSMACRRRSSSRPAGSPRSR